MNLTNLIEENPPPQSFFIPVGLSPFQNDLLEVLIKLHKNSIIEQLEDSPLSYNTQDGPDNQQYLTTSDLNTLFHRNLLSIQNHPYLLVEHFMPKKLLLMESHERLMAASDKFNKFDKILMALQDQQLNLVVVGHNIKELDLIEAFILGRELSYKRYSGRKLHSDVFVNEDAIVPDKKLNKDFDDYAPKPIKKKEKSQLSLHLITTHQLYNTSFQNIDAIISFDPTLNEKESSVEYLRSTREIYVPVIKLLVIDSDYHAELNHKDNKFQFLAHRHELNESLKPYDEALGTTFQNVASYFKDLKEKGKAKWPLNSLPSFSSHTNQEVLQSLSDIEFIDNEEQSSKRVKLEETIIPEKLTIKDYKNILARLTVDRITKLEDKIVSNRKKLNALRVKSTIQNNNEDELKLKIGKLFKESRELKEQVVGAEKKHERVQNEFESLSKIETELHEKVEDYKKEHDETKLDFEISELESVLESLKQENDTAENELTELRSSYQEVTSKAAEISTRSKQITEKNTSLSKKLNNETSYKLRTLKNEEIKLNQKDIVERLTKELEFLQVYKERLDKVVKEKTSNLNVGRNGRVHRSTTPYNT